MREGARRIAGRWRPRSPGQLSVRLEYVLQADAYQRAGTVIMGHGCSAQAHVISWA
jgi:hypothetical protein